VLIILLFLDYGSCLLEHMLVSGGLSASTKIGTDFNIDTDLHKLINCFVIAENFLDDLKNLKEVSYYFKF
jgi:hypothetical protein